MSKITQEENKLKKKLLFQGSTQPRILSIIQEDTDVNHIQQKNLPLNIVNDELQEQGVRKIAKADAKEPHEHKIKATYYLTVQENKALMDVYIKRLQNNQKTDKSALIGEAIQLLYKKESKIS